MLYLRGQILSVSNLEKKIFEDGKATDETKSEKRLTFLITTENKLPEMIHVKLNDEQEINNLKSGLQREIPVKVFAYVMNGKRELAYGQNGEIKVAKN